MPKLPPSGQRSFMPPSGTVSTQTHFGDYRESSRSKPPVPLDCNLDRRSTDHQTNRSAGECFYRRGKVRQTRPGPATPNEIVFTPKEWRNPLFLSTKTTTGCPLAGSRRRGFQPSRPRRTLRLRIGDTDRRIHAGSSLEFPETFAVRRVECCEPAVVSSDKNEATRCSDGSAITVVFPSLLPYEAVRLHIQSGEDSCARNRRSAKCAA